jgi:localization factor PodJL
MGRAGRLSAPRYAPEFEPDESMNSRVSWSAEGIDPSVRERAEAAARRAGMSLNDWLNSTIGASTPPDFRVAQDQPRAPLPSHDAKDVADIHQRLDSITRQIEQISKPAPRSDLTRNEPGVAKQLNEAISRLDARLSQISNPAPVKQAQRRDTQRHAEAVERAAAQVYPASAPLNPATLDFAIAEIAARQSELDNSAPRPLAPRSAPPIAPATASPAPSGPDFSGLEKHLLKITSQIEALQRPDNIEQSIAAFRSELNDIRHAITEAMPRRAIESIENEIRSLSRRIDDSRQSGIDDQILANIERALNEIRETLRSMTPAEQLAGYDEAIRNLSAKLDMIVRSGDDPGTIRQLEDAIAALRSIVSNVASTDALTRLSEDVHALSTKVDQFARSEGRGDSFAVLEARIAALTSSLESRERPVASDNSEHIEGALRALMDRLDHLQVGNDSASAFAHLEQRVSYLLERLEASPDHRSGNLGRVEEGLQDVLRHLETQHAHFAALADNGRSLAGPATMQMDGGLVDLIKRELSDMQFRQTETGRQTQDALEVVHNTLGHVVDRLAMIEGDLRAVRAPSAPPPAPVPAAQPIPAPRAATPQQTVSPPPQPELPNPVTAQPHFAAAPREFHAAERLAAPAIATPRAISEILEPQAAPIPRAAIEPDLPPDHPLEPGTRPLGRAASPSERIAASERAISEISPGSREQASTSSFIAAARRAAQAAAAQPAKDNKTKRIAPLKDPAGAAAKGSSTITSKIRSLLVGASVVVIVLGTFKMAMTLLDSGTPPSMPESEISSEPPAALPPAETAKPTIPVPAMPSMTSPTPIGRQSLNVPLAVAPDSTASVVIPQATAPVAAPLAATDITGTIPQAEAAIPALPATNRKLALIQIPPTEKLPDGIGGPVLRTAALKGDPSAAYEIGVRYAEGKGVPASYDDAAKWYDRAAQAGLVPAIFRLGTLYEKGLSVKKDIDIARRYYLQAAERGNAKAMHNLAVLDADGGGNGANYKSASQWFRKAADRGVADSQFNLGILYARGIGVEQNLAESFKWFSLAAAQGDADSVRKRDDIAKRLDAQSLAAAKLAIQTFTPEGQPDDAVNVASPAGGWDVAPTQASSAKPSPAAAKPALTKRAAR